VFCTYCGQGLLPAARFCGACGRPTAVAGGSGLQGLVDGFVHVSAREVVLLDKITGSEILKSPVFRFLCLFALTPLAILVFESNERILYALAVWSGVFWALLLFRLFSDRELQFRWAVGMVLCTAFVVLPVFEFYLALPPHITERLIAVDFLPVRFVGYVLGVGMREELCKALPLIALALVSSRMKNPLNGLVLGMMSGIGFAISENVYYVHRVHDAVLSDLLAHVKRTGHIDPADFDAFVVPVYNNVVRMMTGPFGHGVYSGIFGYFISLAAAARNRRVPFFLAGLGLSSLVHGVYDTFSSPLLGALIKAFNFFLLMTYILKARGLTSARDLGGGLFSRTVIGRPGRELAAALAGAAPPPLPSAAQPAWALVGVGGPAAGSRYALDGELRVGRDPTRCSVHLTEAAVSRQHALLVREGGAWRVRRLSTTGPVYVNGRAVEEAALASGDQLQVGSSVFIVEG
jgi:RsiW-degrading membrane proteinase PrsW (M82 family)